MNSVSEKSAAVRDSRYYSLDFWRGVACVMVVLHHAALYIVADQVERPKDILSLFIVKFFDHCWVGVPMFFVISGYCIVAACDSARLKPRRLRSYFYRRFRRIFPPYWAAMVVLFAATGILALAGATSLYFDDYNGIHPLSTFTWSQWFGNFTLTEGWRSHIFGAKSWFWLGTSWTLCYEEQFYAVCGLALLLPAEAYFAGLAAVTAAVVALVGFNGFIRPLNFDGFFFDGHWLLFAAGCLVYWQVRFLKGKASSSVTAALLAVCAGMLGCRMIWHVPLSEGYFVGFAFAAAISFLHRWDVQIVRARSARPLIYCGMMCYSLYLIHWPIVKFISHALYNLGIKTALPTLFISVPISFACSIAAGWLFHLHVERRFLNTPPVEPWKIGNPEATITAPIRGPLTASQKVA